MESRFDSMVSAYRSEFDQYDCWGSVMKWRFNIADELYRRGGDIPESWGYRPGACGAPEPDEWDYDLSGVPAHELIKFGDILKKEADRLESEGKSY